jgi:hypothetical protein
MSCLYGGYGVQNKEQKKAPADLKSTGAFFSLKDDR